MTANLLMLRMTTTGDKSESESGLKVAMFSLQVFLRSGND